ncbi:MAG: YdeI/OmpD-associated family protein [Flavobacterium sp.]|nr:YdeI/OmpD-associated family protein [Flavobacterium sp.]
MILLSPNKRIICTLNNSTTFHCAMLHKKPYHYIMLSRERIKTLNIDINEEFLVEIVPDISEFGMEMSEELKEVLYSDPEGKILFDQITSGKKRSIIYLISKTKNPQLQIEKSSVFLEHLKRNKGKFDPIIFQDDYRKFRENNKF